MRRLVVILLGLGLIALPGVMMQPALTVQVTTGDGAPVLCTRVTDKTPVMLEFTHSMYGGFVRELYHVNDHGELERQQVITELAAAAEYYATDGQTSRIEAGYEVLGPPFTTNDLIVRVDARGDHWLTVGRARYHLAKMLPGSTQIHIHGGRISAPGPGSSCP